MSQGFKSAGVATREVDLTGKSPVQPSGLPAGVIGTSTNGQAFVPTTLATIGDFLNTFGAPTVTYRDAPLAVSEWLRNSQALTFLRVLGAGDGKQRVGATAKNPGSVNTAGFVVGSQQPQLSLAGNIGSNAYAVLGGIPGKTYFLGSFMSQSAGSTIFTDAGLPAQGAPIVRGVLFAASGVLPTLSSAYAPSTAPSLTTAAAVSTATGAQTGSLNLNTGLQEFVLLLNGFNASDSAFSSNVITASFDIEASNYFGKILNQDPLKIENAGHYLYTQYDIHSAIAVPTGSGIVIVGSGSSGVGRNGFEQDAFLVSNTVSINTGSVTIPNYEGFENRYSNAKTPWIVSQKFGGKPKNLFQLFAISDGENANTSLKVSIENIQPSNSDVTLFGSFDLVVRDFNDNDDAQVALEQWRGLSLDINNPRYIGNIIGDLHTFYNFDATTGKQKLTTIGSYPVNSKYIYVSASNDIISGEMPQSALPMGFRGFPHLVTSGSDPMPAFSDASTYVSSNIFNNIVQPPVPFRLMLTKGTSPTQTVDKALYWGVQFERQESATNPNSSYTPNGAVASFTKYFADYQTALQNPIVYGNEGTADTANNGILDADRFNNNLFTLENVQVVYNSVSLVADSTTLNKWIYVRPGSIAPNPTNLTRALSVADLQDPSVRAVSRFTVPFWGGFNGTNIFNADTYALTNEAVVEEMNFSSRGLSSGPTVSSYINGLSIMSDTTEVDVQLLCLPGIRHRYVTDTAIRTTENRFDAMLIFDVEEMDVNDSLVTTDTQVVSVPNTVTSFSGRGLNSSFAAAYFPDVNIQDPFNNEIVRVPPSVAVLGAFSKNDAVSYPWFAPAGFTRGVLETVDDTVVRLSKSNLDALYSVNINPIASFAGSTSPVVWGQKTVLARQSALERVNVRRLLISLRREVRKIANKILWEQNKEATLARFSQLVNPIFKKVQSQQGLDGYKVVIDTSTTTQADVENKTVKGMIFIIPSKSLEFLSIDFVLTNTGNFTSS